MKSDITVIWGYMRSISLYTMFGVHLSCDSWQQNFDALWYCGVRECDV